MSIHQFSALGGSSPFGVSVAVPVKLKTSPARNVAPSSGVRMVATGGVSEVTVNVAGRLLVVPAPLATTHRNCAPLSTTATDPMA